MSKKYEYKHTPWISKSIFHNEQDKKNIDTYYESTIKSVNELNEAGRKFDTNIKKADNDLSRKNTIIMNSKDIPIQLLYISLLVLLFCLFVVLRIKYNKDRQKRRII
jgi:hypothetical protein